MRGLSFGELLDYCAEENNHWRDFFKTHPDALGLPADIAGTKNVREVVLHMVVQMRYAERLLNMPITEYDSLAAKSGEELFALSRKSFEDLRSFAIAANDPDWDGTLTFPTRSAGELTAQPAQDLYSYAAAQRPALGPARNVSAPKRLQAGLAAGFHFFRSDWVGRFSPLAPLLLCVGLRQQGVFSRLPNDCGKLSALWFDLTFVFYSVIIEF
jgi:hypothetical protein